MLSTPPFPFAPYQKFRRNGEAQAAARGLQRESQAVETATASQRKGFVRGTGLVLPRQRPRRGMQKSPLQVTPTAGLWRPIRRAHWADNIVGEVDRRHFRGAGSRPTDDHHVHVA